VIAQHVIHCRRDWYKINLCVGINSKLNCCRPNKRPEEACFLGTEGMFPISLIHSFIHSSTLTQTACLTQTSRLLCHFQPQRCLCRQESLQLIFPSGICCRRSSERPRISIHTAYITSVLYKCNRVRDRYEDEVAHTLAQPPQSSQCGRKLCKEHERSNM
jgi:hypothetical protein